MNLKLTIGWFYPELMNTYSDRGNIICFSKRCQWRKIDVNVISIDQKLETSRLKEMDLLFGGGAQDRQQEIVTRDLLRDKAGIIKEMIEKNTPGLFTCGSYQLLGQYYEPSIGKRIKGLGIFDLNTIHPGIDVQRCIGDIAGEVLIDDLKGSIIVGFENHGGRTKLGKNTKPLAKVLKGFGNNGEDGFEGAIYKSAIGTYFHGPVLPKNPFLADYLIKIALQKKYKAEINLCMLDESLEIKARQKVLEKLNLNP